MLPHRITALIVKEFLTLLRDPKVRMVLIAPPLLQLFLFSFAATLEVKNVSLAVYNQDAGAHGQRLVERLAGSPTFTSLVFVDRVEAFAQVLDEQQAIAIVHIPHNFSRLIAEGRQAGLQVLLDGRRSNAAQIVNGYLSQLVRLYSLEIQDADAPPVSMLVARNWFNENLLYIWFTVPSLVGVLAMLITLMVTALSVAREKELGTFDQLLVSPLMPHEILIGKTIPAVAIGLAEGLLIVLVSQVVFRIPFVGSFPLLVLTLLVFVLSVVGVGLFISSLAKTQQQAILGAFTFMVPSITLSGFAAPIENMPHWLQKATLINPLRHCLVSLRGLFLKDLPLAEVWANTWPLLLIGVVGLLLANWFFAKRLE